MYINHPDIKNKDKISKKEITFINISGIRVYEQINVISTYPII